MANARDLVNRLEKENNNKNRTTAKSLVDRLNAETNAAGKTSAAPAPSNVLASNTFLSDMQQRNLDNSIRLGQQNRLNSSLVNAAYQANASKPNNTDLSMEYKMSNYNPDVLKKLTGNDKLSQKEQNLQYANEAYDSLKQSNPEAYEYLSNRDSNADKVKNYVTGTTESLAEFGKSQMNKNLLWAASGLVEKGTEALNNAAQGIKTQTYRDLIEKYGMSEEEAAYWDRNYTAINGVISNNEAANVRNEYIANYSDDVKNAMSKYIIAKREWEKVQNTNGTGINPTTGSNTYQDYQNAYNALKEAGIDLRSNEYQLLEQYMEQNYGEAESDVLDSAYSMAVEKYPALTVPLNAYTYAFSPYSGLTAAAGTVIDNLTKPDKSQPTDTNRPMWQLQNLDTRTQNVTNEAIQRVADRNGIDAKYGQFAYGTGSSIARSLYGMAIGGAVGESMQAVGASDRATKIMMQLATLPSFGGSAYASTLKEALGSGMGEEQAQNYAIASGINEMLFEELSLDKAWGSYAATKAGKTNLAKRIFNVIAQAGIEGSEEVFTDLSNTLADNIINSDMSEYNTMVRNYMEQNPNATEEEARAYARTEYSKKLGETFLAGAISGGVTGGVSTVAGMYEYRQTAKNLLSDSTKMQSFVESVKASAPADSTAANIVNNTEVDNLTVNQVADVLASLAETGKGSVEEVVTDAFIRAGETEEQAKQDAQTVLRMSEQNIGQANLDEIADRATSENRLTAEEIESIKEARKVSEENEKAVAQNPTIGDVLADYQSGKLQSTSTIAQVAQQVAKQERAQERAEKLGEAFDKVTQPIRNVTNKINEGKMQRNAVFQAEHDGNTVEVLGVDSVKPNGKIMLNTSEGRMDIADLNVDNKQEAVRVLNIIATTENAKAINYALKNFDATFSYASAVLGKQAFHMGQNGVSIDKLLNGNDKSTANALTLLRNSDPTDAYLKAMYDIGVNSQEKREVKNVDKDKYETIKAAKKDGFDVAENDELRDFKKAVKDFGGFNFITDYGETRFNGSWMVELATMTSSNGTNEFAAITHEMMEFAESLAPEAYKKLSDSVMNLAVEQLGWSEVNDIIKKYQEAYRKSGLKGTANKTYEQAKDEFINDFMSGAFSTEEGAKQFIEHITNSDEYSASDKVSILESFAEWVDHLLDTIKNFLTKPQQLGGEVAMKLEKAGNDLTEIRKLAFEALDEAKAELQRQLSENNSNEAETTVAHSVDVYGNDDVNNVTNRDGLIVSGLTYDKNGDLRVNNVDKISDFMWKKILTGINRAGYGFSSVEQLKTRFKELAELGAKDGGYHLMQDQADVFNKVFKINAQSKTESDAEKLKSIGTSAARFYGTTEDYKKAGYMTVNGSLLDFSDGQRTRVKDHREINEFLDSKGIEYGDNYSDSLITFMNLGNIRMQTYGVDIATMPTPKQVSALKSFFASLNGEVTVDFSNEKGDSVGSAEYAARTSPARIINDIETYFKEGTVPEGNADSLSRFYSINVEYANEVQNMYDKLKGNVDAIKKQPGYFVMGNASDALKEIGLSEKEIKIGKSKIGTILDTHEEMNIDIIKKLPDVLEDPIAIMSSLTQPKTSIVVLSDLISDDKGIVIALAVKDGELEVEDYVVTSAYGRTGENLKRLFEKSSFYYVNKDKIKTRNALSALRVQFPSSTMGSGLIKRLPQSMLSVNNNADFSINVDSDGNNLSEKQAEYFNDSKVRDDNGRLIVMYHGSKMPGFTEFNPDYSDDGISLFFTDTPDMAASYSGTEYEFLPDKKYTLEELNAYADEVSQGNWEVKKDGSEYIILEAGDYEEFRGTLDEVRDYIVEQQTYYGFTDSGANYKVYINLTNPLIVDAEGRQWNDLSGVFKGKIAHNYEYAYLYSMVDDDHWEIEYSESGELKTETFTREELEKKFGKDEALSLINGDSITSIVYAEDGSKVPAKTRDYSQYAYDNGYDGVIFKNILDYDNRMDVDEVPGTVVIAFNSNQVKSVNNTNPTENDDIRYSINVGADGNYGYHAGDLGKAEAYANQSYSRGTGHFGTGTYFVGDIEKIKNYNKRNGVESPKEIVDFSKYNLYNPRTYNDGMRLHEALKVLDGNIIKKDWIARAANDNYTLYNGYGYLDLLREKYGEVYDDDLGFTVMNPEAHEGTNYVDTIKEYADSIGAKYDSFEEWKNNLDEYDAELYSEDDTFEYNYEDYLKDVIKDYADEQNKMYHKFYEAYNDLHWTAAYNKDINKALMETADYVENIKNRQGSWSTADSVATKFMKALGYEGVDVRGIDGLDNTAYGSVIYDLKGEDLARKQEIGTARFSIDVGAENFNAAIDEMETNINGGVARLANNLSQLMDFKSDLSKRMVSKVASNLKKSFGSDMNTKELETKIMHIFNYLRETGSVSPEDIELIRTTIGEPLVDAIKDYDPAKADEYDKFVAGVKTWDIALNDEQMQEVRNKFDSYYGFKRYMSGKLNLNKNGTLLDDIWTEICDLSGGALSYGTNPNNQPLALAEYINSLEPKARMLDEESYESASMKAALEVFREFFVETANKDAAAKMRDEITEYNKAVKDRYKKLYNEALKEVEAAKAIELERLYKEYENLTIEQQQAINEGFDGLETVQIQQLREDYKQRIQKLKEQDAEKLAKVKADYKNKQLKDRENKAWIEAKHKLVKEVTALQNMLAHPKEAATKHVPVQLVNATIDLLNALQMDNGRNKAVTERLANLAETYEALKSNVKNDDGVNYGFDYDERIAADIEEIKQIFAGGKFYTDLYTPEIERIIEIVQALKTQIKNANNLIINGQIEDARRVATEAMQEVSEGRRAYSSIKARNIADAIDTYGMIHLNPYREMRKLSGYTDGSVMKLYDDLEQGSLKQMRIQQDLNDIFKEVLKDQKAIKQFISTKDKDLVEIGIIDENGKPVKVSRAMRMSIIMHSFNEGNMRHILFGGIKVPNMETLAKNKSKAYGEYGKLYRFLNYQEYLEAVANKDRAAQNKMLTEARTKINSLVNDLSDWELKFLEAAKTMFHEKTGEYINDTSVTLKGYTIARVKNYFPIKTDTDFTPTDFAGLIMNGTIEGMGMLKERVQSGKPIMLEDITDVIQRQISNTSRYAAFAIPVRNFKMAMRQTFRDNRGEGTTLEKHIREVWNQKNVDNLRNMITAVETGKNVLKDDNKLANMIRGNFSGAVLTLNPSVAIKQAASYPTAAAVLGFGPLAKAVKDMPKGFAMQKGLEELEKRNPLLWYRAQGYGSQDLADAKAVGFGKNLPTWMQKAIGWTQFMDTGTVRTLEYASKYYVDSHYKNLKQGSNAYWDKVSEVFTQVVTETQPNYDVMHKASIIRDGSSLTKMLVMFKTQPMQNFGILYDSIGEWNAAIARYNANKTEANKEAKAKAFKKFARASISQLMSAITFSSMSILARLLLHKIARYRDDDDEWSWEKLLAELGEGVISAMTGMFIGGSEIYETVKYWAGKNDYYSGIEVASIEAVNDFLKTSGYLFNSVRKLNEAKTSAEREEAAQKIAKYSVKLGTYAGQMLGIPAGNIYNIIQSMYLYGSDAVDSINSGSPQISSRTDVTDWEVDTQYERLYKALMNNDTDEYNKLMQESVNAGSTEENIATQIKKHLKANYLQDGITAEEAIKGLINSGIDDAEAGHTVAQWETGTSGIYGAAKTYIHNAADDPSAENRKKVVAEIENILGIGKDKEAIAKELKKEFKSEYNSGGDVTNLNSVLRQALTAAGYTDSEAADILKKWLN